MAFLIIFLVALAISAVGFYRYIWFISIGYGFSIAGIGAALLIYFGITGGLTAVSIVMAALLIVYGLRLGGYLLAREYRSSSYHQVMQQAIDNGKHVKLPQAPHLGGLRCSTHARPPRSHSACRTMRAPTPWPLWVRRSWAPASCSNPRRT